jgi:demethylmenaquinone methyltransferase/2-methoxy-6-polyprenyl-1,4-benzoquinol methylase
MKNQINRVTRTKAEARANYNRISRWYDVISGPSEAKFRQIGIDMLEVQEGERVLEIGVGTGHAVVSFGENIGDNGSVTGIDLSDEMSSVSQKRILDAGLDARISLCQSDGARLPFCDDLFDAIFMSFTLELFDTPEILEVVLQCRRVLKHAGRVVNISLLKTENPGFVERIYEWLHVQMPVMIDCRPIIAHHAFTSAGYKIDKIKLTNMWGLPVEIVLASVEKE